MIAVALEKRQSSQVAQRVEGEFVISDRLCVRQAFFVTGMRPF